MASPRLSPFRRTARRPASSQAGGPGPGWLWPYWGERQLDPGSPDFIGAALEALSAVGFAVGSLALAGLADKLREGQWITISFVGMALIYLFFSLSTAVPIALIERRYAVGATPVCCWKWCRSTAAVPKPDRCAR